MIAKLVLFLTVRVILVCPAASQARCNAAAADIDPTGGARTFNVGYILNAQAVGAANGSYVAEWQMSDSDWKDLQTAFTAHGATVFSYVRDNLDPKIATPTRATVLTARGIKPNWAATP